MFSAKLLKNLENIVKVLTDCCITLEIWSLHYEGNEMKSYIDGIVNNLRSRYPEAEVLSIKKSKYIETRTNPYLQFKGYALKISPDVDLSDLKKSCMRLEIDSSGKRISDIDVYYKGEKISRKCCNET